MKRNRADGIDVEGRQPGFYLYAADLERELRPMPLEMQALWVRMLLQMHWGKRRGYLEHSNGAPFTSGDLARVTGIREKKISSLLEIMEHQYGTFSRDENGIIFNRRMVRDTDISKKRKEAGKKGGNPALVNEDNHEPPTPDNQNGNLVKHEANQKPAPSSSSSISSSTSTSPEGKYTHNARAIEPAKVYSMRPPLAADLNGHTSNRFEEFWSRYPRQQRKDFACREWVSRVSVDCEHSVFSCLERYLASDEVARGVVANPDKWLYEQGIANWEGSWPPKKQSSKESYGQMLERILPS